MIPLDNLIEAYSKWYGGKDNLKIYMKPEYANKLRAEANLEETDKPTYRGIPVEIYDRIEVDYYVTQKTVG